MMGFSWRAIAEWIERADLGGWAMLWPGLALVAMVLLIPAHQQRQVMQQQHDMLAARLNHLQQTAENYTELRHALHRRDPQLIQRLAWRHLNLKPVDTQPVRAFIPNALHNRAMIADMVEPKTAPPRTRVGSEAPSRRGLSPQDRDKRARPLIAETKLVRLATGPYRSMLLVAGALLIGGGLWTSLRQRESPSSDHQT